MMNRRHVIAGLLAGAAAGRAAAHPLFSTKGPDGLLRFGEAEPLFGLHELSTGPVRISHFDVVEFDRESILLRCVAENGDFGVVAASPNKWWEIKPLLTNLVQPYLVGEDARELESRWWRFLQKEYEYSGAPLWNAWGHAENAVLDLLGQVSAQPVATLLGGVQRDTIPLYISSSRRGGDPDKEIDALEAKLAETGCRGVKVKIGLRMGRNRDAAEGWTKAIVCGVRNRLGEAVSIYVDANGAFDAPTAIGLAPLLEEFGVSMMEEPCPYQDIEMTGQITRGYRARRSQVLIAGGENEGSPVIWRDLIDNHLIDVGQPDPQYGGGLLHCMLIARRLHEAGLKFNPHWPRQGAEQSPLIHLCAAAPSLYGLQEYRLYEREMPYGPVSEFRVENGAMRLPDAPGLGVAYDPALWDRAVRL